MGKIDGGNQVQSIPEVDVSLVPVHHRAGYDRDAAELVVVRHGRSKANAAFAAAEAAGIPERVVTGPDREVELDAAGVEQASAIGTWLAAAPPPDRPEIVLCTPYVRGVQTWQQAMRTAAAAGVLLPVPRIDDRLADRGMGILELLHPAAIAAQFPAEATRRKRLGESHYRARGGESLLDVADRLRPLLVDVRSRYAGRRVWLVAHDAVVMMLGYLLEGMSLAEIEDLAATNPPGNGSFTRFTPGPQGLRLADYNQVRHLDPRPLLEPVGR